MVICSKTEFQVIKVSVKEKVANTREIVVGGGSFRMYEGIVTKNSLVCLPLVLASLQEQHVHEHHSSQ